MAGRNSLVGQLFDYGVDIMVTTLGKVSGVITAQLGDSTAGKPDSDNAEWWQHVGFASRPALPTNGGASAQGVILKCSDRDLVIATRDTRGTAVYGNLADGETAIYACSSQAAAFFKKNGSASLCTTDTGTAKGNTIQVSVSPVAQSGGKGGEFRWAAPFGGAWQDATGYHQRYWFGGSDDVGVSQIPGVPVQTTTRTFAYDYITLSAAFVQLGAPGGAVMDTLVQTKKLIALLTPLLSALSTTATALTAIGVALKAAGFPVPNADIAAGQLTSAVATLTAGLPTASSTSSTQAA